MSLLSASSATFSVWLFGRHTSKILITSEFRNDVEVNISSKQKWLFYVQMFTTVTLVMTIIFSYKCRGLQVNDNSIVKHAMQAQGSCKSSFALPSARTRGTSLMVKTARVGQCRGDGNAKQMVKAGTRSRLSTWSGRSRCTGCPGSQGSFGCRC